MSQHDMSIVNQGFPAFRADLNDALPALASNNSGATEPSTMFAHQWWVDTSASPSVLKQRNADNDAWITVGSLDQSADTFTLAAGSAGAFSTLSASGTSTLAAVNSGALAVTGAISSTTDATLSGVRVGKGAGAISTNTALGLGALNANTSGSFNTASGFQALLSNTTGNSNTASGLQALYSNTTGSGNTAINPRNSAGSYAPVFNPSTENNRFCMGSTGVTNAYIQVAWTVVSDARDKINFAPVPHGLEFVKALQPTAYQFRTARDSEETNGGVRYGFKAQDVLALEGANPVIVDNEDADKLRMVDTALIPVLVKALQELNAKFDAYVLTHP